MRENRYEREAGYALRYRDRRFRSGSGPRTHARETGALARLLARVQGLRGPWLDVPSGAGRMSAHLPQPVVQADRDLRMLEAAGVGAPRVCASGLALPFPDRAFAGVLCMRLMHHIADEKVRLQVLRELCRVTQGPVVLSFFHSASLQHLRRVVGRWLGRHVSGRTALTFRRFHAELDAAGLRLVQAIPLRRYVSEQWLVLAQRSVADTAGI